MSGLVFGLEEEPEEKHEAEHKAEPEDEHVTDILATVLKEHVIARGMGLLDCGATDTVGGYEPVEILADRSRDRFGDDAVEVDTSVNPTYRFGNQ